MGVYIHLYSQNGRRKSSVNDFYYPLKNKTKQNNNKQKQTKNGYL